MKSFHKGENVDVVVFCFYGGWNRCFCPVSGAEPHVQNTFTAVNRWHYPADNLRLVGFELLKRHFNFASADKKGSEQSFRAFFIGDLSSVSRDRWQATSAQRRELPRILFQRR